MSDTTLRAGALTATGALLDIPATAEKLGVEVRIVRSWITTGVGPPSARIGKRRYFRREDIDAWLDEQFAAQVNDK